MVQNSSQNSAGKWFSMVGSPEEPPWASTGVKVPWSLKGCGMGP